MHKIKFYIFGIPDGFDIYQETPDADIKSYYQCFYDESVKDNTRLAVHRKINGECSYTFLKYHLFSCGNRSNSFIGLSVVFSGGYYSDVSSLYNLLEYTYNDILHRGILLQRTPDGNSAKFMPSKFSAEVQEVKRIESFIINTLNSREYSIEFSLFDRSFEAGKQNAILKIPFMVHKDEAKENELNLLVINRLRQYSWLSLSPDYIKRDTPSSGNVPAILAEDEELDPMTKARYTDIFESHQGKVLDAFNRLVNKADEELKEKVARIDQDISGILSVLVKYKKQNDLQDLLEKYSGLAKSLDTLKNKLYQQKGVQNPPEQDASVGWGKAGNNKGKGDKDYLNLAVAGGAVLAAVCVFMLVFFLVFFRPDKATVSGGENKDEISGMLTAKTDDNFDTGDGQSASRILGNDGVNVGSNDESPVPPNQDASFERPDNSGGGGTSGENTGTNNSPAKKAKSSENQNKQNKKTYKLIVTPDRGSPFSENTTNGEVEITIDFKKLYTIKVYNWEYNGKFCYAKDIVGLELNPSKTTGENAYIKVRATELIQNPVSFSYKKGDTELFTIKLTVVVKEE